MLIASLIKICIIIITMLGYMKKFFDYITIITLQLFLLIYIDDF
jgi:hypothetical protein